MGGVFITVHLIFLSFFSRPDHCLALAQFEGFFCCKLLAAMIGYFEIAFRIGMNSHGVTFALLLLMF